MIVEVTLITLMRLFNSLNSVSEVSLFFSLDLIIAMHLIRRIHLSIQGFIDFLHVSVGTNLIVEVDFEMSLLTIGSLIDETVI